MPSNRDRSVRGHLNENPLDRVASLRGRAEEVVGGNARSERESRTEVRKLVGEFEAKVADGNVTS